MDTVTFNQAIDLIELLIIVIAMVFLYRSVPAAQLEKLFIRLEASAKQTATPVDDTLIGVARLFAMLVTGQQPVPATTDGQAQPQPVPMTVTGTVTASPAPAEPAPTVEIVQTSAG